MSISLQASITGHGSYDRVTNGPGATMPTDSGFIDYVWEQIGDPHSGTFSLTQTGDDRYDLLEAPPLFFSDDVFFIIVTRWRMRLQSR